MSAYRVTVVSSCVLFCLIAGFGAWAAISFVSEPHRSFIMACALMTTFFAGRLSREGEMARVRWQG